MYSRWGEIYIPIQFLTSQSVVKTYLHGNKQVSCIIRGYFKNNIYDWSKCMYMAKSTNTEFEDLIVTGTHSILVD